MKEEKQIIYTDNPNEGIWTSKISLLPIYYPITSTIVVDGRMKWNGKVWTINLRDGVIPGEIIEVRGHLNIKYRVLKNLGFQGWGYIYSIKRLDDRPITQVDIGNAKNKTRVRIAGRKSAKDVLKIVYEL